MMTLKTTLKLKLFNFALLILTLTLSEVLSCSGNSTKELGCGEYTEKKFRRFFPYFSIELALDTSIEVLFSSDCFHACLLLSLPKRKSLLEELNIQAKLLGSATLE